MRKLLALTALCCAFAVSPAQLVQEDTPAVGTVYSYSLSTDGSTHLLAALPVYETFFALPFGLDFSAGWGGVYGQRMQGTEFVDNVFGVQVYAKKRLGGSGAFLMGDIHALVGESKRPAYGIGFSLGWEF